MLTAVKILSIVTVCIAAIVYVNRDDTGTISANLALYIVSEAKLRILYVLYN